MAYFIKLSLNDTTQKIINITCGKSNLKKKTWRKKTTVKAKAKNATELKKACFTER